MRFQWLTVSEWETARGSGRTISDQERPCSICLLDFDNDHMMVVAPDGPGVAYLICGGDYQRYRAFPQMAWGLADRWVRTITDGFGAQHFHGD